MSSSCLSPFRRPGSSILYGAAIFILLTLTASGQTQPAAAGNTSEMATQESSPTFKVNVKEVLVRVVARDQKGNAVGNLTKEDFQLFDKGKPQTITHFSVEQAGARAAKALKSSQEAGVDATAPVNAAVPERFVAYLFDDIHLQFGDLTKVREAAERHLATLRPTDRAAIFTTSGKVGIDYTDDRAKLHETLLTLKPNPITGTEIKDCPNISYYMADLIVNKDDRFAEGLAISDALSCNPSLSVPATAANPSGLVSTAQSAAAAMTTAEARLSLERGNQESRITLQRLKEVVDRLSLMPGQRSIVLVSPGFLIPELGYSFAETVDRALRSQAIISSLDARGLFAQIPGGDASQTGPVDSLSAAYRSTYDSQEAFADAEILSSLADATGGVYFHNSNDLDEGLKRVAETPEYFYMIGFAPQNLKPDGSFHALKVSIKSEQKLTLQTRKGYYAPKHAADPAEDAKQQIQDAIFSQEELREVPLDLHTQFFKTGDAEARLTVLAHLDVRHLPFHKIEGRNGDELTVVSALFDRNGTFIQGNQKVLTFRFKDETLAAKLDHGITMKTSFDAKPGSYLVRVVVRDAEGQMSAQNGAVEIP